MTVSYWLGQLMLMMQAYVWALPDSWGQLPSLARRFRIHCHLSAACLPAELMSRIPGSRGTAELFFAHVFGLLRRRKHARIFTPAVSCINMCTSKFMSSLRLQIAQSRSYPCTLCPKVGILIPGAWSPSAVGTLGWVWSFSGGPAGITEC